MFRRKKKFDKSVHLLDINEYQLNRGLLNYRDLVLPPSTGTFMPLM